MKKILSLLLLSIHLFGASVNVAVAANMSYAISAIKEAFQKSHPNTEIDINLASSGKLTAQIKHGAPYDLFLSANMRYPHTLSKEHLTLSDVAIYAQGSLVLFSKKERDFSKGISTILEPSVKRVAVGNPKTAPYGKATKEALLNADIYNKAKEKFIYGESISQTLTYTMRAAEMGFIAKSSLFAKEMLRYKEHKNWIDIDKELYRPISQGVVLLKRAKNNSQAKEFYQFILSDEAKKIFNKFGYTTL